jgi:hypothetical protein
MATTAPADAVPAKVLGKVACTIMALPCLQLEKSVWSIDKSAESRARVFYFTIALTFIRDHQIYKANFYNTDTNLPQFFL